MLFQLIIMELNSSNSKASDRVQSKRPIETPGFLISHILIARLAFWGYLFTIRDFFPRSKLATDLSVFGKNITCFSAQTGNHFHFHNNNGNIINILNIC